MSISWRNTRDFNVCCETLSRPFCPFKQHWTLSWSKNYPSSYTNDNAIDSRCIRFYTNYCATPPLIWDLSQKKTLDCWKDIEFFLPDRFRWIQCSGSKKKENMSQKVIGWGRLSYFTIGMKNTNMVEGVEILHRDKFRLIPLSVFRGEVENGTINQRLVHPSCFPYWHGKHILERRRCDLASFHVFLIFVFESQFRWFHSKVLAVEMFVISPQPSLSAHNFNIILNLHLSPCMGRVLNV